jgi:hypothetical protein
LALPWNAASYGWTARGLAIRSQYDDANQTDHRAGPPGRRGRLLPGGQDAAALAAEIARATGAELMLPRRWGPLARLVLGGTGERLAHGAQCSLLIVPRPPADEG